LTREIETDSFLDLIWPKPRRPAREVVSSSMLLHGALINAELLSQIIDGHAICIALDQLFHLGQFKSSEDPSWGSSFGRFDPRWDHFEDVPETFSLVRMVQVTSHYLHRV
jgi:hypothetical protein